MDWEAAKFWVNVAQFVLMGAIAFYVHIVTRQRVTEQQLDDHKDTINKTVNGLGQRLTRVEEAGRHSPTHADIGDVHEKLNEVNGQLREVIGELNGVQTQLRLINQHLLDKR